MFGLQGGEFPGVYFAFQKPEKLFQIRFVGATRVDAGGVPVVKVKDIENRSIDIPGLLLTSPTIDREYRRSRLKEGDVLFTIRGTVGRVAIVPAELENANITQDTARIDLVGVRNDFISFYFETASA